ncbi:hypothetical protein N5D61_02990 [Pseudomonas sp. GD03842]|uniref:hypothetical protein n=1 Tax=Pseudomonas sp. GD03842 TaxID=2975385 RepID=UPI00244AE1C4|nr:hypothetical protein [Pseudomonas sp. GD03842]MDH0745310.1 hypothetical protein [Pseudomonas sp. GD03842]
MYFLITPRRRLGVALKKEEVRKATPARGDVHIREDRDEALGRVTITARVFNTSATGFDELPSLVDASVTSMAQNGMNVSGVEEVGGVLLPVVVVPR